MQESTVKLDGESSITYRAQRRWGVGLFALFGVPTLSSLALVSRDLNWWPLPLCFAAALYGSWLWWSRFRITFSPDSVVYRSLVGGERAFAAARASTLRADTAPDRFHGPHRLTLIDADGSHHSIHARMFASEVRERLLALAR